jgi:hypothetical protein
MLSALDRGRRIEVCNKGGSGRERSGAVGSGHGRVQERLDVAVAIGEGDTRGVGPSICGTWSGISM